MERRHSSLRQLPLKRFAGRSASAGQSLVEFSLMLIFLTVLLMGVLDLGRAYFTYLALKDAAGEGAYFGSAFPQCVDANGIDNASAGCGAANNIPYRVTHSAPRGGLVDWAHRSANIRVDLPCGTAVPCVMDEGQTVTVTVSYSYQMLTPFVGAIADGNALTLSATSSAVIIRVPNCTANPCR